MDPDKRVFSEQEVSEIIRRAAELQERSSQDPDAYRLGVTREELERAAVEVGVSPEFLQQAIREKLAGQTGGKSGFQIAPEEERVVEGELDPENFDVILDHLPIRASRRFPVSQVGRSLHARARSGSGLASVALTSRNGRTRIRVKPLLILEAIGSFYPAFLLSILAAAPLAEAGQGPLGALIAAGAFVAATFGFLGWSRKSRQNAAKLADKLQAAVAEELEAQAARSSPGAQQTPAEDVQARIQTRT